MGRRRKSRLDLPQRVYFDHGIYFFVPINGPKVNLGRELPLALAKWAEIVAPPMRLTTVSSLMDRYLLQVAPRKSKRTYADNKIEIALLRKVFGHMAPDDITPQDIYAYMDARGAPIRANREKSLLSHIFSVAIRWGAARDNPCRLVKRNPEKPRDRYVSDEELATLRSHCPAWLQLYLDLKSLTGMRKGDMLRLTLGAITADGLAITQGKTGQRLIYEWNSDLRSTVESIKGLRRPVRSLHLFTTQDGQPFTQKGFNSAWQRAMGKAVQMGLARFTEHDLRAKVVTDARNEGLDAQRLAGHKNSAMTDRYVKSRQVEKVRPLKRNIPQ